MLGGCIISAAYTLKADIYSKKRFVTKGGQVDYKWEKQKEVLCYITTFTSTSFKAQATSEAFGDIYEKMSYLIMSTSENIGRNAQVTNIRSIDTGEVIFSEVELKDSPPTWYNTNGSQPEFDPFGRVLEWKTLLSRAEEQGEKRV